jgi:preprotein translocase subunit SecG
VQILTGILTTILIIISLFLICLILIQRGKGGGLAGAFGGMGGSSAFGTKAGDIFTRVTMVTALAWILLNMVLVVIYNRATTSAWDGEAPRTGASKAKEVAPTGTKPAPGQPRPAGAAAPATAPAAPAAPAAAPASKSAAAPAPASAPASAPVSVPAIPDK